MHVTTTPTPAPSKQAERDHSAILTFPPCYKSKPLLPAGYPEPAPVPLLLKEWHKPFPTYLPPHYESAVVLANDRAIKKGGWADSPNFCREELELRKLKGELVSFEGEVKLDGVTGAPLNPRGRIGISGRGLLGCWGPNFAADTLVTRYNPNTFEMEMLAIQRQSGEWAIPGGMVDKGEKVSGAAIRELAEESGLSVDINCARLVYQGYVEDPRNTDNAWMESSLFHLHLSDDSVLGQTKIRPGSDARDAEWIPITEATLDNLYASHGSMVKIAISQMRARCDQESEHLPPSVLHDPTLTNWASLHGKIGVLGGSFDPIHRGHLQVAYAAMKAHGLSAVVFIPAKQNPLKDNAPMASDNERIEMLKLSFIDEPRFYVSPLEVRRLTSPSYTVDTLRMIREENKSISLYFIIGSDCLPHLSRWHSIDEIGTLAHIIPVQSVHHSREDLESLTSGLDEGLKQNLINGYVEAKIDDIRSTQIRSGIASGNGVLVNGAVEHFIRQRALYNAIPETNLAIRI